MIRVVVFRLGVHSQLKKMLRDGKLSQAEFQKLTKTCTHKNMKEVLEQTQQKSGQYPALEALWKFILENWPEILKIIITLAALVLDSDQE